VNWLGRLLRSPKMSSWRVLGAMGPSVGDSRSLTSSARLRQRLPTRARFKLGRRRLAALLVQAKPATDIKSSNADSRPSQQGAPSVSPLFPRKPSALGDSLPSLIEGFTRPRTQRSCPDACRRPCPFFLLPARPRPLAPRTAAEVIMAGPDFETPQFWAVKPPFLRKGSMPGNGRLIQY